MSRTVVVGASSGLGRCIGVGLARRGDQVALLARRRERIEAAAKDAGPGAIAIGCDVTDEVSCRSAINDAAEALGGIDNLVYTPAVGPLVRMVDTDAQTWRRIFDTNVIGAALVTAAAVPHLTASAGKAVYLSSDAGTFGPPWPGLGSVRRQQGSPRETRGSVASRTPGYRLHLPHRRGVRGRRGRAAKPE